MRNQEILHILDDCAKEHTFPMLDNGYWYPASTRLNAFYSQNVWALTIEVFGFSPRSGLPDTQIFTYSNRIINRKSKESYISEKAYNDYISMNPYNEMTFIFPIDEGDWMNAEEPEIVNESAKYVSIRGNLVPLPKIDEVQNSGISLAGPPALLTFELCRFLAINHNKQLFATDTELCSHFPVGLAKKLELYEWFHPDLADGELPSESETFRMIADVLVSGDTTLYVAEKNPNTHWLNWPDGGIL